MAAESTIEDRLRTIICDVLGVEEKEVVSEASFIDDLNADSLEGVDITLGVEEEFDIQISDEDVGNMKTVKDVLDYLHDHLD